MSQELVSRPSGLAEVPDVIGDTVDHAVRKNPSGLFEYKPKTYEPIAKPKEYSVLKPIENTNYSRMPTVDPAYNSTTTTKTVTQTIGEDPNLVRLDSTVDPAFREATTTTVTRVEHALVPSASEPFLPLVNEQPHNVINKPYIYRRTDPHKTPYNLTNPLPANPPYVYRKKHVPDEPIPTYIEPIPTYIEPIRVQPLRSTNTKYARELAPPVVVKVPTPPLIHNSGYNGSSSYTTYYETSGSAANTGNHLVTPPQANGSYSYHESYTGPKVYSTTETRYTTEPAGYSYKYEAPPVINQSKVVTESRSYTTSSGGMNQGQAVVQPPQQSYEYMTYNESVGQITQPVAEKYHVAKEEVRQIVKPPTPHREVYQEEVIIRAPSPPRKVYHEEVRNSQRRVVNEEVLIKPPTPPRVIHQEIIETQPVVVPPPSVRQYIVTETITTTTTHNDAKSEQSAVQVETVRAPPVAEEIIVTENIVTHQEERKVETLKQPTPPPPASSVVTTTTVVQEKKSKEPAVEKKRTLLYMAPPPRIQSPLLVPPPPVPPTGILSRILLPPTPQKREFLSTPPAPTKAINLPPAKDFKREQSYTKHTRKMNYSASPARTTEYHKVLELNYDHNPDIKSSRNNRSSSIRQIDTSSKKKSSSLPRYVPPPPEPPRHEKISTKYMSKSATNGYKTEVGQGGLYPPIRTYDRIQAFEEPPPVKYETSSGTHVRRTYHTRSSNLNKIPMRLLEESQIGLNDRVIDRWSTGRKYSNERF